MQGRRCAVEKWALHSHGPAAALVSASVCMQNWSPSTLVSIVLVKFGPVPPPLGECGREPAGSNESTTPTWHKPLAWQAASGGGVFVRGPRWCEASGAHPFLISALAFAIAYLFHLLQGISPWTILQLRRASGIAKFQGLFDLNNYW
jgi:hypothetical protein